MSYMVDRERSYNLFTKQKEKFIEKLKRLSKDPIGPKNYFPKNLSVDKPSNWFIMFYPKSWGHFKHGFSGVHWGLNYYKEKKSGLEFLRLSLGVEKPLKDAFKEQFKNEVMIESRKLHLPEVFDFWPHAGIRIGTKLLETRVPLNEEAADRIIERYSLLTDFNLLVAKIIKRYSDENNFLEPVIFK